MASYNAGRSLAHLLTNGVFESMNADKDGYVSVAQAADQLLTRRSSGFRRPHNSDPKEGDAASQASMRTFVQRTVATFGLSRPGYLNRREFARMYETFVKRPAQFAQLIGAAAAETEEADGQQSGKEGAGGGGLVPGPPMSQEQLRSLVDQVNEKLAEEQCSRATNASCNPGCASNCTPTPTSNSGGFVLLNGQGGGSDGGQNKSAGKPGKIFEEDLQLD
ncbi:hypothetical protein BOX15_Mlig034554g1 [Macrostomum lignano]|uniref:Uncharacterized protein n=1 Tax=Macrostomum lignano TaxID=282301 RepID=A0A267EWE5_9PLAT|nr:hypothetical protein BOX15_Mlig034554g1 [Macrostomum lignano]